MSELCPIKCPGCGFLFKAEPSTFMKQFKTREGYTTCPACESHLFIVLQERSLPLAEVINVKFTKNINEDVAVDA
jgi:Zn finger protein HypA/HybF involved in hydrogenase expression